MRTTLDIDDTLLQRLRDDAHREGVPFRTMLHRVLQRGLDARPARRTTHYRTPSVSMGRVHEGVDLVKALGTAARLEDEAFVRLTRDRS